KNVSHKNAPGAISAMALEVNPASPRVGLVPGFSFDDMSVSFLTFWGLQNRGRQCPKGRRCPGKKPQPENDRSKTRIEDFRRFLFDTSLCRLRHLYRQRCSLSTDFSEQFRWQAIEIHKQTINKAYGIYCTFRQRSNWMPWQQCHYSQKSVTK